MTDEKIQTKPEAAQYIKPSKEKVYSRLESGNLRLWKALDMLIDYLVRFEMGDQEDVENSDDQCTEPPIKKTTQETDGNDLSL